MPEPIIMELGMYKYIMPAEAISMAYFINPPISSTNIAASQIIEVITLILLECLD
jgi:hypothetical protein